MSDELPSGDKAVFAFLEMLALAFAFEGAAALLHGEPLWRVVAAWIASLLLFVAGIKWPRMKVKLGTSPADKIANSRDPRVWLAAGAVSGILLYITTIGLIGVTRHFAPNQNSQTLPPAVPTDISNKPREGEIKAMVQFLDPVPVTGPTGHGSIFARGATTRVNVLLINTGPEVAKDVVMEAKLYPISVPRSSAVEDGIWKDFMSSIPSEPAKRDLGLGEVIWGTFTTDVLSEQQARDLLNGRLELGVLAYASHTDSTGPHHLEFCRVLQPPDGKMLVWQHCYGGHNRQR